MDRRKFLQGALAAPMAGALGSPAHAQALRLGRPATSP